MAEYARPALKRKRNNGQTLSTCCRGVVQIDFSDEPSFDVATHGLELTFCLTTKANTESTRSIFLDDGGNTASVLRTLTDTLKSFGFKFEIERDLNSTFQSLKGESTLINAVRLQVAKSISLPPLGRLGIKRELKGHQLKAVEHGLKAVHPANFSVPGSGKTTVALSIFAALKNANKVAKIIVIGPASCFAPWVEEFNQVFGRPPATLKLIGTLNERRDWPKRVHSAELLLSTYQMAYREKDNLVKVLKSHNCLLILDESHYIKNMNGAWATTILELAPFAKHRMILTGTPAPRFLKDLSTQFTFLWPSQALVWSKNVFENKVSASGANSTIKKLIQPFFVRITKKQLGLPDFKTYSHKIPYSEIPNRQRAIIRLLEERTLAQIRTIKTSPRDLALIKKWRKARIIRLMQASSNPMLLNTVLPDYNDVDDAADDKSFLEKAIATYGKNETPAKIEYVVNKTRELVKKGRKVLIWATFINNLRVLKKHLSGLGAELIYGDVPPYQEDEDSGFPSRERIISQFKDPKSHLRVLIANPAACAESISLHTVCHDAIYLERSFNCGQFLQSLDRIHRVGLKKSDKTSYYIPLIDTAIERVIDARLSARQRDLYDVLGDPAGIVSGLDGDWLIERDEELEDIFHALEKELLKDASRHARSSRSN